MNFLLCIILLLGCPFGSLEAVSVSAPNMFELPVVQQTFPSQVTDIEGEVTQFGAPKDFGVLAFLGHNYLSGTEFFEPIIGTPIFVELDNGQIAVYQVKVIEEWQAANPLSIRSDYIRDSQRLTANDLFLRIYGGDWALVLQVSIAKDGNGAWGRRFVLAQPLCELCWGQQ
jgi:hypothetical protein